MCFSFLLHIIVGNVIKTTYCRLIIKAAIRALTRMVVLLCFLLTTVNVLFALYIEQNK